MSGNCILEKHTPGGVSVDANPNGTIGFSSVRC